MSLHTLRAKQALRRSLTSLGPDENPTDEAIRVALEAITEARKALEMETYARQFEALGKAALTPWPPEAA